LLDLSRHRLLHWSHHWLLITANHLHHLLHHHDLKHRHHAIKIRSRSSRHLGNHSRLWHHRNGRFRNRCGSNLRNHRNGRGATLDRTFRGTLFLKRTNKAKTRITAALVVRIVMKTFVLCQVIGIVFILVQTCDSPNSTWMRLKSPIGWVPSSSSLASNDEQTTSGTESVCVLVSKITLDCKRTNDTIETIDSELVVRMNTSFTNQTGLTMFLCEIERCD